MSDYVYANKMTATAVPSAVVITLATVHISSAVKTVASRFPN